MFFENLSHGKAIFRQSISELDFGCLGCIQDFVQDRILVVFDELLAQVDFDSFEAVSLIDRVDRFCRWCRFRFVLNRGFLIRCDEIDDGFAILGIALGGRMWVDMLSVVPSTRVKGNG